MKMEMMKVVGMETEAKTAYELDMEILIIMEIDGDGDES